MEKIHAATVREFVNHIGLKDRHARRLVVDEIFNGGWKQEVPLSVVLVPTGNTIAEPFARLISKKKISLDSIQEAGLSEESLELLRALQVR